MRQTITTICLFVLSAAQGRLFLTTVDGRVLCFKAR